MLEEGGDRARLRDGEAADRIGSRGGAYHRQVDAAFRQLAEDEAGRFRLVDASGEPHAVTARLLAAIEDLLP
jgi:dTMP kinase